MESLNVYKGEGQQQGGVAVGPEVVGPEVQLGGFNALGCTIGH